MIYSYLLDLLFFKIEYGTVKTYYKYGSGFDYFIWFIVYYVISIPFLIGYNFVMDKILPYKFYRYLLGILMGLLIGYCMHESGISYYIGQYRPLKNILLFGFIGLSLELTRTFLSAENKNTTNNEFNKYSREK